MTDTPTIEIKLSLSSNVYRRSASEPDLPSIVATTTLITPSTLMLSLRGETDSGTILEPDFRAEHFEFWDLTASLPVTHSPFPGSCDPGNALHRDGVVQLESSSPLVTRRILEDMSPLSDPVRQLEVGHEYRLVLKSQMLWCYRGSIVELFGEREYVPVKDLPKGVMVALGSDDESVLRVEA